MPIPRVRMSDVARVAGVSRTTASFVLNGRDWSIPAETRDRVRRVAQEMGYRPNAAALALATGTTHRIGILLNEPESFNTSDPYFINVLKGITVGALRHDYNLLLYSAHYPNFEALSNGLLSGSADGVLLVGRYSDDRLTPALLDAGLPCVCISYHIDHPGCYAVDCDNRGGAQMALDHLIERGHRQFCFCYPGDNVSWGRERLEGAQEALRAAGIPAGNLRIFTWSETHPPSLTWIEEALEFIQSATPQATAVICCDEWRAQSLCEALPQIGLRVPEDVAMISFNSTEASARCHPPLTSVWQPLDQIGEAAVNVLVDLIAGRLPEHQILRLPMRLDARDSSRIFPTLVCGSASSSRFDLEPEERQRG